MVPVLEAPKFVSRVSPVPKPKRVAVYDAGAVRSLCVFIARYGGGGVTNGL